MMIILKNPPLAWNDILAKEHWHLYLWMLTGILFGVCEFIAIIRGKKDATFTYIVKKGVPRWLVAAVLGWLTYHFLIES
jgi:hypothetical protein